MRGYIKDHRKELESDIWLMPPLYHRVWQYLKYKVNHDPNEIPMTDGSKLKILPGQHLTSIRNISKGVGWYEGRLWKEPNPKTIKSILDWLEKVRMLSVDGGRGNRQYTLITLLNWELYQSKDDWGNTQVTATGEGRKQLMDINNNDKECIKNVKEIIPDIFSFWKSLRLVQHRTITAQIKNQITWKLAHYSADELKQCISNYADILINPDYVLDTKWSLDDFLEKGHFEKFLNERDPYSFYPKTKKAIAEINPPAVKQTKLQKNKDLLLGKGGKASDGRGDKVSSVQSFGSLPEPVGD